MTHRSLLIVSLGAVLGLLAGELGAQDSFSARREAMVRSQIEARGIREPRILDVMRSVPRHEFVPGALRRDAYGDHGLDVGDGQSLSQPYTVALMTQLLELDGDEKILEIGTGTGYHTAILARLAKTVYSMEIVPERAERARRRLASQGYGNVRVLVGNGYEGLPDQAPFDAIVLTAAPKELPEALLDQLRMGGRLVVPLGGFVQELRLIQKTEDGFDSRRVELVRFGPMVDGPRDRD